jgi:pyridoxal phosphate enzyme (YggS family)
VAVSKTKPASDIEEMYALGQRDFGENYVQELVEKQAMLPADIQWHFIGHLQSNKVKYIAPFVFMIHGVDSLKLLQMINRQGATHSRKIRCLLQVHNADE